VAISSSARGDREHCIRITTARQKNQCFCIIEGVGAGIGTTSCVSTIAVAARCARGSTLDQQRMRHFIRIRKNIDEIWDFKLSDFFARAED
jgi:hypothetical protein